MGGDAPLTSRRQRLTAVVSREALLEGIRADIEERQYLWSGEIDPELYAEDCNFTDPTLSFQGLDNFERNIRNLRPILDALIPENNRRCILRRLQHDHTSDKIYAEWIMVGDLVLPWRPRIKLGGRTTYTPGPDGRIVSYDEMWDISPSEALLQIFVPANREGPNAVEHWPGRLLGYPPPEPRVSVADPPHFVVLPGFGNDAVDYVAPLGQDPEIGLQACLARRGVTAVVSPVRRVDWLQVFIRGLMNEDFRAGNGTADVAFGWYLDLAKELVEQTVAISRRPVVLLGHSAGGWLGRALMQREGRGWVQTHIHGLVTLGTPHLPPPEFVMDMTRGCLRNLHKTHPDCYFSDVIFYITIAGDAIVGQKLEGNVPILELIQSQSTESTAWNSYSVVCGNGGATGDGIVPVTSAHLDGAVQLTLKGCTHSINVPGTTLPTDRSYMCEMFVDDWLEVVEQHLHRV